MLGCGYVLLALLLGHAHFGDGGHAHGHDTDHTEVSYGVGGGGHGAASAGHAAVHTFHFPFFSPLALATLLGGIGAWGLIVKKGFGASDGASLAVAVPAAVLTAYLVTYAGWRLVAGSTGSSQIRMEDLTGAPAEVITPIPTGGLGEVAAIVRGQRYSGPAREAEGRAVARGTAVTVKAMVGATMVVAITDKKE